ncbi:DUF456 domain-containing protein [Ammoniphilus resinae]|uniref:Uncharacterized protein YqgC (DUF456 family) n=1 Tax=Ammoniphilus resinae TaxID=861532 RepID=A0ABS4GTR6_9BACL|nr:DUF456 family protein [Ammoniphilus resinae]MBP1933673.1 uncharacterized protein YqgC (DUF456 family) [Ammoniphilus resinae]
MDILFWSIIILLFIASMVGIFVPVIPDALFVWGGFLIYQFLLADQGHGLPASFWWGMAILTILLLVSDFLTNMVFVKKYGGSKWGMAASVAGLLIGPFVMGPIGLLLGPFIFVLLVEWARNQDFSLAFKVGIGSMVAFFGSALVKLGVQAIMIVWFFLVV